MSAGVCSVLKSRPRRVRRSISNNSVDVHGAVTVKKIWLEEGGNWNLKQYYLKYLNKIQSSR